MKKELQDLKEDLNKVLEKYKNVKPLNPRFLPFNLIRVKLQECIFWIDESLNSFSDKNGNN